VKVDDTELTSELPFFSNLLEIQLHEVVMTGIVCTYDISPRISTPHG
jgi:hypothetical protein